MAKRNTLGGLLMTLFVGGLLGSIASYLLGAFDQLAFLSQSQPIGFDPIALDLSLIKLTIGFQLRLTLGAVVGILVSFIIYRNS